MRVRGRRTAIVVGVMGLLIAAAVISPALGGPSLKKLVKKEVRKQLRNKQGPPGPAGISFDASAMLPSGQTLTGVWAVTAGGAGGSTAISFAPQLPGDLGSGSVHRMQGSDTSAACPGPGAAAAGHLCVYERDSNLISFQGIFNPADGTAGANRRGAQISYASNNGQASGSWAVTAS